MNGEQFAIESSEYLLSVAQASQLPAPDLPEVAFAGRSNAGKSSLINALCGRKALAYSAKQPGKTQLLNFFKVRYACRRGAEKHLFDAHLVDLPGYGYAKVGRKIKAGWASLLEDYLLRRERLSAVVLAMDSRREPEAEEHWFVEHCAPGTLLVAATKVDTLSKNQARTRSAELSRALGLPAGQVFAVSSTAKAERPAASPGRSDSGEAPDAGHVHARRSGLDELRDALGRLLTHEE